MATTQTQNSAASLTAAWSTYFKEAKASWAAARKRRASYNRTYHELASLTDAELADLGFARANIPQIAKEASNVL